MSAPLPEKPSQGAAPPPRRALDKGGRALLMRCLKEWVAPHWRRVLVALALMACLSAATGAYPQIIKYSFDALTKSDHKVVTTILAMIVGVTAVRALFLYLTNVATHRIVLRLTVDVQKQAFAHLLRSDYARLTREAPGALVSRLTNDVALVQTAFQAGLATAVRDVMVIAVLVGYMIYKDPILSLIVLGIYPLAIIPVMQVGQRLKRVAKRTQEQLGDMTALLAEKLGGARLIKTFKLEGYAAERMNASFEQIYSLRMKAVRNRARLDPMLEALGGAAVAGVIGLATWRIAAGISSVGDFMAFIAALVLAAQPTRGLGNLTARVQEGLAAAERLFQIIDEKPTVADRPGAKAIAVTAGAIDFAGVSFAYPGTEAAVRELTLAIPGGKTVALVGRSGAGKSTVINLVPRLFDVTTGAIRIDGQDVRDVTLDSLRGAIAIVSQEVTLFDDTIRANIALGRLGASEEDIVAAAKAAAAHDFIMAQPQGYDTEIGDRGLRLSGGQRQRLALARAILKDAPILLLDEATSALDTESEQAVQEALARFTKGRTTLVIAHRLSTVQSADLICVMDEGRLIETGTHVELLSRGGPYSRLVRTQALAGAERMSEAAK